MRILGIDVATTTALALVVGNKKNARALWWWNFTATGETPGALYREYKRLLVEALEGSLAWGLDGIVWERNPVTTWNRTSNARTMERLFGLYAIVQMVFDEMVPQGIHIVAVAPNSWQQGVLSVGGRARRRDRKTASVRRAALQLGLENCTVDEADAANMAHWALVRWCLGQNAGGVYLTVQEDSQEGSGD